MGRARLLIALVIAAVAIIGYYGSTGVNPLTGETQRVAMSPEQEITLGLKSAPQMAAQMGGISANAEARALVRRIGDKLARESFAAKSPYKFSFHVLADPRTVNAFALPGGPIFITEGLLRVLKSEAEVAAVLGHEIGHVIARHSSDIRIMDEAGYDPRAMIRVMEVLGRTSGGSRQPEFLSTHPAPENRATRIREEIAKRFPGGVPQGLTR